MKKRVGVICLRNGFQMDLSVQSAGAVAATKYPDVTCTSANRAGIKFRAQRGQCCTEHTLSLKNGF